MMNVSKPHEPRPTLDTGHASHRDPWDEFLQRNSPQTGPAAHRPELIAKRILITGAGGSIGSALALSLAHSQAQELVLLDSSEGALHEVSQSLLEQPGAPSHTAILGSVTDPAALTELFERHRPHIVFHAGAFKHVPLMETNPFAVISNNALGTRTLVEAAADHACEQFILLSTDKAVDPLSLMGASKRIAELIALTPRPGILRSKAVRLGNVLGSSGSVAPLFERQIAHGGPVTVSHPDARRYFMTHDEAVEALLQALSSDCPDDLLIPNLGAPIRILDLAKHLIAQARPNPSGSPQADEIPIVFTALRPGDKMEESLISQRETCIGEPGSLLREVRTPSLNLNELTSAINRLQAAVQQRDLRRLLEAVLHIVPEYQPSQLLREQLSTQTMVTA